MLNTDNAYRSLGPNQRFDCEKVAPVVSRAGATSERIRQVLSESEGPDLSDWTAYAEPCVVLDPQGKILVWYVPDMWSESLMVSHSEYRRLMQ